MELTQIIKEYLVPVSNNSRFALMFPAELRKLAELELIDRINIVRI